MKRKISETRINFLCDGEKEDCRKGNCYKTIGDCEGACKHTKDICHAKNFNRKLPQTEQSSFWENEAVVILNVSPQFVRIAM